MTQLNLAEELLLLNYGNDSGRSISTVIDYGLSGALIVELLLAQRIKVVNQHVMVIDPTATNAAAMDITLHLIATSSQPTIEHCVGRVGVPTAEGRSDVHKQLLSDLITKNVLSHRAPRGLMRLFADHRFPTLDPRVEEAILQRLIWIAQGGASDPRAMILLFLAHASDIGIDTTLQVKNSELKDRLNTLREIHLSGFPENMRDAVLSIVDVAGRTTSKMKGRF